ASLAAYECVLEGNALPWDEPDGETRAIRLFEKAIEIDPGYALAHALLANMHFRTWYHDPGDADAEAALDETYALAKRAVELDNNESTCFSILAQVCLLRRAYDQALRYGRRALEINPTNQWNTADMGIVQLYAGDAEVALAWFLRAREIDPYFDPPWYFRFLGVVLMTLHRYEEALAMLDHLPPHQYRVAALMAGCHARLGHVEPASACAATCLANKPGFSIRHFMAAEPFKDPAEAADLAGSLQMAGLPA
ncbi:MAG: tetratricopeptide repeat protein, partial [Rhodanobacteraceae bacterium]